jgi:aerobic-type carbon monoxide dehydrogenase small subunit (CoxS/CutS family)
MTARALRYGDARLTVDADDARPLLDVLRAELGVRSAARACTNGACGACRVMLDGELVASCLVPWRNVPDGARVETYETLSSDPTASRAVEAFAAERPTRCRLCVGALAVTAVSIARSPLPPPAALDAALETATCMCTGRSSWRRALTT